MIPILAFVILINPVVSRIGFGCSGRHLNVTTMFLLDVGECNLDLKKPNVTRAYIQLLQLSDYSHAEVLQCKVEISRTIIAACSLTFLLCTTEEPIIFMKLDIHSALRCFKME